MNNEMILEMILKNVLKYKKEYIYIIDGNRGPTGKTWLTGMLKSKGYNAIDISESVFRNYDYKGSNSLEIDEYQKCVIIVLNEILPKYKDRIRCC